MKIYWHNGRKNVIGDNVRHYRTQQQLTQKELAEELQRLGFEFDRLTVGRIETGDRFVADYEVFGLSTALKITLDALYQNLPQKDD